MAGTTKRAAHPLAQDQATMLRRLARSRTAPPRKFLRARVLSHADGSAITDLARLIGVSRPAI